MAKVSIVAGATSQSVNIFIQDSSSTVGAGLSGLVFNTSGLIAYYTFTGANATATQITLATLAAVNSAFSSGGFKEIDATNMKGTYRLDLPNAALATSKGQLVTIQLGGATNMAPCVLEIELTGWNNQDGVHGGMTALPNAAAGASGGLIINGSNSGNITLASTTLANMTVSGTSALAAVTASSIAVSGNLTLGNISNAGTTTLTGAITGGATTLASLTSTGTMTAGNISVGGTTTLTGAVTTGALTLASMTSTGTMSMGNVSVGGTTTLTGAVSLGSTLGITGATTLAAISAASIAVSGNTTLTGIVTAANVSNNIVGVTVGNVTLAASQGNITMNITGNLSGSVGSVTGLTVSNLDATISSRMATYTQPTGFLAATFPSAVGDATAANQSTINGNVLTRAVPGDSMALTTAAQQAAADTLLGRNVAGGSSSGRLVKEALYVLRNKVDTGAGIVYQVDDTSTAFTFSVTTAPGNPVTVFDPS